MKKNIKLILIASLASFLVIFCAIAFIVYGQREQDFKDSSLRYAQNTAQFSAVFINEALNASDDIKLFSILEALSKSENIASSFIADSDAKIIMHSDMSLVSKPLNEAIYKEALLKNEPLLQRSDKNSFVYSLPLTQNNVLFIQIAQQESRLGNWKTAYLLIALLLTFIFTAGFYFALKKLILTPFEKTKSDIERGIGSQSAQGGDEISDILLKERKKNEKALNLLKAQEASLSALIEHFCESQKDKFAALIVLNSLNNIVFAHDKTAKLLKSGSALGQNVLEAAVHPELLSLIAKSNDNPNKEIGSEIAGGKVSAFSLSKGGEVLASIIRVSA